MKPEEFTDVTYEVSDGLAWITIARPERYNAFRARTVDELVHAFKLAWADDEVGVVALTGAGPARRRSAPAATRSSGWRPVTTGPRSPDCSRWRRCTGSSGTSRSR